MQYIVIASSWGENRKEVVWGMAAAAVMADELEACGYEVDILPDVAGYLYVKGLDAPLSRLKSLKRK